VLLPYKVTRELGREVRLCVPPDFRSLAEGRVFAVAVSDPRMRFVPEVRGSLGAAAEFEWQEVVFSWPDMLVSA
jgi:hypothetical protein